MKIKIRRIDIDYCTSTTISCEPRGYILDQLDPLVSLGILTLTGVGFLEHKGELIGYKSAERIVLLRTCVEGV